MIWELHNKELYGRGTVFLGDYMSTLHDDGITRKGDYNDNKLHDNGPTYQGN